MSSGGAALMAVQVLVDHGVPQEKIVFVTYFAGRMGLMRLTKVFPEVKVVVCTIVADFEERVCSSSFLVLFPKPTIIFHLVFFITKTAQFVSR